jgi:hypothetical protein
MCLVLVQPSPFPEIVSRKPGGGLCGGYSKNRPLIPAKFRWLRVGHFKNSLTWRPVAPRTVSAAMAGRAERDNRARVEPRARVVLGDRERVVCLQAAGAKRLGAAAGAAVAVASKHGCAGALPRRARPDGVLPLLTPAGGIPASPLSRAARAAAAFARRRIWSPASVAEIHQRHGSPHPIRFDPPPVASSNLGSGCGSLRREAALPGPIVRHIRRTSRADPLVEFVGLDPDRARADSDGWHDSGADEPAHGLLADPQPGSCLRIVSNSRGRTEGSFRPFVRGLRFGKVIHSPRLRGEARSRGERLGNGGGGLLRHRAPSV